MNYILKVRLSYTVLLIPTADGQQNLTKTKVKEMILLYQYNIITENKARHYDELLFLEFIYYMEFLFQILYPFPFHSILQFDRRVIVQAF